MPDKQELDQVYQVINKLDTAIDKLADVSSDIKQILAVHEQRLDQTENIMERHFVQMDAVHSRVSQLRDDMNAAEKRLLTEISDINKWRWQMMGAAAGVAALVSIATKLMPM
jgi:conjugal transfer/entry exclusion protein